MKEAPINETVLARLRSCRALLFDLDGVITDTMPRHCEAWLKAFKELHGITLTREEIYRREGEKSETSVLEILVREGFPASAEDVERLVRYKASLFDSPETAPFFPGMDSWLQRLARHRVLAMVTGTQRVEVERLFDRKFLSRFQAVITSSEVTHGKPHPEPYRRALTELALHPREAVVIENAPLGVESAKQAGIFVVALGTSLSLEALSGADAYATNHDALFRLFTGMIEPS